MPEGQFSGIRKSYEYTSDLGIKYLLTLDETLGSIAGTGLTEATTETTADNAPGRFEPRVVYWQGTLGTRTVRKQIVCGTSDGTLYNSNKSQALTIDGTAGVTTGRKGEKISFLKLSTPVAP